MKLNHQEEDKIDLNLDNPIFVCYLNLTNMSYDKSERECLHVQKCFSIYNNITVWIFPSDRTQMYCIWKGKYDDRSTDLIMENFNNFLNLSPTEFKEKFRDALIDNLTDETK